MKIARETNITITEIEETILKASINNQMMNAMNILEISEDLWYLIQSNIENQMYQIQRMLANELDSYRGRRNQYVDNNIQEIQELYKISESASTTTKLSFIQDKVKNLMKYMKFIHSPIQTRLFKPLPHY